MSEAVKPNGGVTHFDLDDFYPSLSAPIDEPNGDAMLRQSSSGIATERNDNLLNYVVDTGPDHGTTLSQEPQALAEVRETVESCWPELWPHVEAGLSAVGTLLMKDVSCCLSLVLVGQSGIGKGTALKMFRPLDETIEKCERQKTLPLVDEQDGFTIPAFLSHFGDVSAAENEERALTFKLKHRVMLTTELGGTMNSVSPANLADLASILDGDGRRTSSGTQPTLGKKGDYTFVWLGGHVPFRLETWKTIAKVGTRLLFLEVPSGITEVDEEKVAAAERECRKAVSKFLKGLFGEDLYGVAYGRKKLTRSLEWPALDPIRQDLRRLGALIALGQKQPAGNVSEDLPAAPDPKHLKQRLAFLAGGRAIIHGRSVLTADDLNMCRAVAASSMPSSRGPVLLNLLDGVRTVAAIAKNIRQSKQAVQKTLDNLKRADCVDMQAGAGSAPSQWAIKWPIEWKKKHNGLDDWQDPWEIKAPWEDA